nr:hypothetical protein CFP56_07162 [Quercus suber]
MRHYPFSFTHSETPLETRQVLRYDSPILFVRVVCEHEIGLGFDQVPERPDPATAESVENTEFGFGFLVERGGENAEVSACGALVPEEGVAGLKFMTPFGLVLGFEARPRLDNTPPLLYLHRNASLPIFFHSLRNPFQHEIGSPILFVCVICEHEIGLGFNQELERLDSTTVESVENTEFGFGFLGERGGENAEVSACGALFPEEGLVGLKFMAPFGLVLGFEAQPRLGEEFRVRVLGNGNGVEEKRGRG